MGFTKEEWDTALNRLGGVVEELKADMKLLMTRNVGVVGEGEIEVGPLNAKEKGACGKLILRKRPESVDDVIETRIAVVGNGESHPDSQVFCGSTSQRSCASLGRCHKY